MLYKRKEPLFEAIQINDIDDFHGIEPLPSGYIPPRHDTPAVGSIYCRRFGAGDARASHIVYRGDYLVLEFSGAVLYRQSEFLQYYEPVRSDDHVKTTNIRQL